jgi:hypothetical protein
MKNTINMKEIHFAYLSERDTATPTLSIQGEREGAGGNIVEINIPFTGACYLAAEIQGTIIGRVRRANAMLETLNDKLRQNGAGKVEVK